MQQSDFTTELIHDPGIWARVENDWRELYAKSACTSSSLAWDWLYQWWLTYGDSYGSAHDSLAVILIRRGSELVAALPLYIRSSGLKHRRLGFIGTGEKPEEAVYSEKLDCLCLNEFRSDPRFLLELIQDKLSALAWHELDCGICAETSLFAKLASSTASGGSKKISRTYPAPFADLQKGFESYLESHSSNSRQQFRRMLRTVQKQNLLFTIASTTQEAWEYFDRLVSLHQRHWQALGERGAFSSPRVIAFHKAFIERALKSGSVVIAQLGPSEKPIAILYGFLNNGCFDFYQSGLAHEALGELKSPGIAAHLLLMQKLSERGAKVYDFLAGASSYKDKLASGAIPMIKDRYFKLTLGNVLHAMKELGAHLSRRLSRSGNSAVAETSHA